MKLQEMGGGLKIGECSWDKIGEKGESRENSHIPTLSAIIDSLATLRIELGIPVATDVRLTTRTPERHNCAVCQSKVLTRKLEVLVLNEELNISTLSLNMVKL